MELHNWRNLSAHKCRLLRVLRTVNIHRRRQAQQANKLYTSSLQASYVFGILDVALSTTEQRRAHLVLATDSSTGLKAPQLLAGARELQRNKKNFRCCHLSLGITRESNHGCNEALTMSLLAGCAPLLIYRVTGSSSLSVD